MTLWFCYQVLYIQAFVLVFLLGKFMRKVFFGQLRAAEMEVVSNAFMTILTPLNTHLLVWYLNNFLCSKWQQPSNQALSSLSSASHRALLVRGDGDVPGIHCVQGWLLPPLRRPLHPPALSQVLPLAGWGPGGLCEWWERNSFLM